MHQKQREKLINFDRTGNLIAMEDISSTKEAIAYVKGLQERKEMADNWKLDIFIDKNVDSLAIANISMSAAFKKGKFEKGIFVNKYFCRGHPSLESKDQNLLIASFLTEEQALLAMSFVINFIRYRYSMELELVDTLWKSKYE